MWAWTGKTVNGAFSCVYHYHVYVYSTTVVVDGLSPFTEYLVSVAAQTRGPRGDFSAHQQVLTEGDGKLGICSVRKR